MRRLIAALLLVTFALPVFAQTPEEQKLAERKAMETEGKLYQGLGAGLLAGGVLLEVLSYTALADSTVNCSAFGFGAFATVNCTELKSTNWPVMIGGLSTTITGLVFIASGRNLRKKAGAAQLTFGPRYIGVTKAF